MEIVECLMDLFLGSVFDSNVDVDSAQNGFKAIATLHWRMSDDCFR